MPCEETEPPDRRHCPWRRELLLKAFRLHGSERLLFFPARPHKEVKSSVSAANLAAAKTAGSHSRPRATEEPRLHPHCLTSPWRHLGHHLCHHLWLGLSLCTSWVLEADHQRLTHCVAATEVDEGPAEVPQNL